MKYDSLGERSPNRDCCWCQTKVFIFFNNDPSQNCSPGHPHFTDLGTDITLKIWGQCVVSKLSICSDDDDDDDVKVGDDTLILQTVCPNECSCSLSYISLIRSMNSFL